MSRVRWSGSRAFLLTGILSLAGVSAVVNASEAELCAEGTGIPREDVMVCTRALILSTLPPSSLATLHNSRGRALLLIGDPREALKAHDAALAANPSSAEAHLGRARAQLDLGDPDTAAANASAALELNPRHAGAWRLLGRLRFLAGDDPGADRALARALDLNYADAEAHAFRGFVRYRQARFPEAVAAFREARTWQLGYQYLPLWQWLAALGAKTGAPDSVGSTVQDLKPDEWPAPLFRVFLGHDTAAVLESSFHGGAADGGETRAGEVAFYLAERDRLLGNLAEADARMARAARLTVPNTVERAMVPR